MITLMLIFRSSMIGEVEELLKKVGIGAYTLLNKVEGQGETGNTATSYFYPGSNSVIFAVIPPEQAERAVSALRTYRAARLQATHEKTIPFKLFAFPCEELI
jgi:nitrogen regulatory protein PII